MAKPLSNIRSAAIDGRMHNPIYRKTQLKTLHDTLTLNLDAIQKAILKDTGHRVAEVKAECWLVLKCLREAYDALPSVNKVRPEDALETGKDVPDRRVPVGIVVIEPAVHTFLYSLLSALVPALAAGNCVIVQQEQTMLQTPALVLGFIKEALDQDVLHVTKSTVQEADIGHRHIRVRQNGSTTPPLLNELVSTPEAPVVAVVERDADITAAARSLVMMRFGLRGKSPYAPDIVLVNEWVKKEFLVAMSQEAIRMADGGQGSAGRKFGGQGLVDEIVKEGYSNVISAGQEGLIVEINDRRSFLMQRKVNERCLAVHAVTSMEDAIDTSQGLGHLAAAYVFSNPKAARYICEFVDSDVNFVNHIPASLLFGPVAPLGTSLAHGGMTRYSLDCFTQPKPHYATTSGQSKRIEDAVGRASQQELHMLGQEMSEPLQEMIRPERNNGIGFFNQAVVTGGVLLLSTTVACTSGLCYVLWTHGWRRW